MKILDRYVLRSFLWNYLISFVVLIGMYIVLDMVFNFDELVERKSGAQLSNLEVITRIGSYYFYQTFLIFVQLSGVIPVVAAAFTLIRMSRFNELSAIMAAGVPLLRVAAPIILASLVLQGLLAVDHELIIPSIIPQLTAKHDELYDPNQRKFEPITAMQDNRDWLLFAGGYNLTPQGTPIMRVVDIIERDANHEPVAHITADSADWDAANHQWNLTRGRRTTGLRPQEQRSAPRPLAVYQSNITPDEIALFLSGEYVNLLSLERIEQLLQRPKIYGTLNLMRVKHFRILQLIMNVIMVLIAIPCVLLRDAGKLKASILKCLVLVGLAMASYFVAFQLAAYPQGGPALQQNWPAFVAIGPVLIFGVLAIYLLDRLATRDT